MTFKAVIFDLDGTLLDSIQDIADTMNLILKREGFPLHNLETYKTFVGNGVKKLIFRSLPEEHRKEEKIQEYVTLFREIYQQQWRNHTKLYPGIDGMLDLLKVNGVKMAILSNKPDEFTKTMTKEFLGAFDFEVVAGALPDVPKKPNPEAALRIRKKFNVWSKRTVFLGDSAIDMETAISAKMIPIGVSWGFRPKKELKKAGATDIIDYPFDLIDILHDIRY
jgi:phosphoglycolate phosphatase